MLLRMWALLCSATIMPSVSTFRWTYFWGRGHLRLDNGPEFTSTAFQRWATERGIALDFISPGRPTQNGFIERFNGSFRREVLDAWLFNTLEEVRQQADDWLDEYNLRRPHESLGDLSPIEFLNRRGHAAVSIYGWT
ncbi:transposase [Marichromatium sp. AB32]|nr:transposase [Marichromatium sp. AB32]